MTIIYTFRCPSCRMPYVFQPTICNVCKEPTTDAETLSHADTLRAAAYFIYQPEPYDDGRVFNGYTSTNPENNGSGRDGY